MPRIPLVGQRIGMAFAGRIQQAPRIAATPRTRGRRWMMRRERWLAEHPLCCECHGAGEVTAGEEVDHVLPLWAGGADDETNYQTLCKVHHAAKTAREAADRSKA